METEHQVTTFYSKNVGYDDENMEKEKTKSSALKIVLVILLVIFLVISLLLINKKTNFLNFASSQYAGETTNIFKFLQVPSSTPEASLSIHTEISTRSSTMIIPSTSSINVPGGVVIENSYIFASPLTATADGIDRIRITIFILDGTGSGIPDKTVTVTGADNLVVYSVQAVTDTIGRALFDVATGTTGTYVIGAVIDGAAIPQKITITFD